MRISDWSSDVCSSDLTRSISDKDDAPPDCPAHRPDRTSAASPCVALVSSRQPCCELFAQKPACDRLGQRMVGAVLRQFPYHHAARLFSGKPRLLLDRGRALMGDIAAPAAALADDIGFAPILSMCCGNLPLRPIR